MTKAFDTMSPIGFENNYFGNSANKVTTLPGRGGRAVKSIISHWRFRHAQGRGFETRLSENLFSYLEAVSRASHNLKILERVTQPQFQNLVVTKSTRDC